MGRVSRLPSRGLRDVHPAWLGGRRKGAAQRSEPHVRSAAPGAPLFIARESKRGRMDFGGGDHGFSAFVENQDEPRALQHGIALSLGQRTTVGLRQQVFDETSLVAADPADDSWRGKYTNCTSKVGAGYESCLGRCASARIRAVCGCAPLEAEPYLLEAEVETDADAEDTLRACAMGRDLGFLNASCWALSEGDGGKGGCCGVLTEKSRDFAECEDKCRMPCLRHVFETSSRTSKWPSVREASRIVTALESNDTNTSHQDQVKALLQDVLTVLREEVAVLTVTPDSLRVMHVSNSMGMDIAGLFGSIGGTLGLFIGFSIITVFELADFLIRMLWIMSQRTAVATLGGMEKVAGHMDKNGRVQSLVKNVRVQSLVKKATARILPAASSGEKGKGEGKENAVEAAAAPALASALASAVEEVAMEGGEEEEEEESMTKEVKRVENRDAPEPPCGMPPVLAEA